MATAHDVQILVPPRCHKGLPMIVVRCDDIDPVGVALIAAGVQARLVADQRLCGPARQIDAVSLLRSAWLLVTVDAAVPEKTPAATCRSWTRPSSPRCSNRDVVETTRMPLRTVPVS